MSAFSLRARICVLLVIGLFAGMLSAQSTNPILVKDLAFGSWDSNPTGLMASDTTLYFGTYNAGIFFRSDGTDAGTELISNLSFPNSGEWTLFNGQVYFAGHDGTGTELWRVNAAGDGTEIVHDFTSTNWEGGQPRQLTNALGRIFFSANDDDAGRELWTTDGTTTVRVADISVTGSSDPRLFRELNGSVYFVADDDSGTARLWKTDGTTVTQFTTLAIGKRAYDQPMLVVYGGYLYFSGQSTNGTELWRSDGTVAGTTLVADLQAGTGSSFPRQGFVAGSRFYFTAGPAALGDELYTISAPGQAPVLVADINPGTGSSFPFMLEAYGDSLFFSASNKLWITNGTTLTQLLDVATSESVKVGRFTYFPASKPATGYELWVTDGTPAGTHIVYDHVFGTGNSFPGGLTVRGSTVFFVATTPFTGSEVFRVDTCDATISASGPTAICPGGSVTLTSSPGASYLWSNGATTQSINATAAGSYTVRVTQSNGCQVTSEPTTVTVDSVSATITPSGPTTFCDDENVTLTANAASSYSWSTGATTQSINVNASGAYSVTVTNANGCSATSTPTSVTVLDPPPTPDITPSGPTTFCEGGSVTLSAPAGYTYLWSTGATTQSIVVTATSAFTVTVTDANGCSATSAGTVVTVNANPATPIITPSGPTTFCDGGNVALTAPEGLTYLWSNGATTQSINVHASGSYSVTVTNANGCTATSDPTSVTVLDPPSMPDITPNGPTTFCEGGSVTLTAPDGYTYLWSTGATTQSIVVTTGSAYSVTVTDGNGCSASSAATLVTVNPNPATPEITPSGATTFCEGGSVTLTAPAGFTYLWSTGATTQSINVTASGAYSVTVTNENGCTGASAPTTVTVHPNPTTPEITPSGATTFCEGGNVTLTAPAGYTYLWSTGATTQSINVTASGAYSVTVTNGNGCTATSALTTVTVNPQPTTPSITPSGPTTFCAGGNVTLTAPAGYTYLWSTGATTQSINVTASGAYGVTVTNGNGCTATSAPTTVTVNPQPTTPNITPSGPTTFCAGGNVTLTAPAGFTYLWSTGATTQSINVTASGAYSVTVTNGNGCSATSAATNVTVTPSTAITQQPQSVTIPKNTSTTLTVTATGTGTLTYQWYRGNSGNTSNPIAGATSSSYNTGRLTKGTYTYWVSVTGTCSTVNSTTATITAN